MSDQSRPDAAVSVTGLRSRTDEAVNAIEAEVIGWRHDIHQHPELSNREQRTAALVADHLRALGLDEVRTGIAGHGVVGVLRGGRGGDRVFALRADMDALPVEEISDVPFRSTVVDHEYPGGPYPVSHACGHDGHVAMVMGAASSLAQVRDELPGTVLFVFQPAEEGPPLDEEGGAALMDSVGALDDPRPGMVFGVHVGPLPSGVLGYRAGSLYAASVLVKIVVTGQQVHGSTPWMGVDPMPVAADIITNVAQLYRQVPAFNPVTISIGHVEDKGRFNIIGESVELYGTVRCTVQTDMTDICQRIERISTHLAEAHGARAEVSFLQNVPAVENTPAWLAAAMPTFERVLGQEHIFEMPPALGYDDVSVFVNKYGGLYLVLGCQDSRVVEGGRLEPIPGGRGVWPNHSPHFYIEDSVLATGVRLHCHVAIDYLTGAITP